MSLVATLLSNGLFLAVLGISVMNAWFWGEMAGIPKGGDKSGLGGLMGVMIFLICRFLGVALVLGIAAWRGGFDGLPGSSTWARLGLVLLVHAAIGGLSLWGFNWVSNGLTYDNMGPQAWSWFFGIVIPLPMLLLAAWGINRTFVDRSPKVAIVLALAFILFHVMAFRSNLQTMRASNARRVAMEQNKTSEEIDVRYS